MSKGEYKPVQVPVKVKASERQVGGSHYKGYKIQPWEFFQINNIPFHKADIIKRILRYDSPTGKGKEDLDKIRHELDLIEEFSTWGWTGPTE